MPKFFLVVFILFLSRPGFTQEEGGRVIYRDTQVNEDSGVAELEAAKQVQLDKLNKIQKTTEAFKPVDPIEELQKLGYKQINATALMDPKVLELIQTQLQQGLLSIIPRDEIKKMLQEKLANTLIGKLTNNFPVLLEIFVDIIRDKNALSGLVHVLQRKEDLKTYGYLWLGIFLFGIWLKNRLIKPKWNFTKRLSWSLPISLILTSCTLYLFYSMFEVEIGPILNITLKYF